MKKLANLKPGAYFFYGGVQWVVLESDEKIGATLALAAEPVFHRAFDEEKGGSRDAGAEQHARRSGRERQRGGGGLKAPAPPPKNCIRKPPRARCAKTSAKRNPPVKTQLINL